MGHIVMPSADKLWGSVATTVSAKGVEDIAPKTDEDWERVRDYAVTLVEATNLLLIPGRHVAEQGKQAADKSELSPEQIETKIKGDWNAWAGHVAKLHDVAMESITAIDKKARTVTVKGPQGGTETIKAKDPKNLEGLKVGDMVEITYTQALAISLDKSGK